MHHGASHRQLLLWTIPAMCASLAILSGANLLHLQEPFLALCSLFGLMAFCCSFVTGLGPIPNIVCAEIFPTRGRGTCISLCAGASWLCTIAVSQAFPVLQGVIGVGGVFGVFGIMTAITWMFVYYQVPETKGLPLEIICDLFSASAR